MSFATHIYLFQIGLHFKFQQSNKERNFHIFFLIHRDHNQHIGGYIDYMLFIIIRIPSHFKQFQFELHIGGKNLLQKNTVSKFHKIRNGIGEYEIL